MSDYPCPVCQGISARRFEKDGYWIRHCTDCKYQYLESPPEADHVAKVYGDEYFFGGGAGYPDYVSSGELVRDHGNRYAKIFNRHMKPGRVLDVGAAAGFFLSGLLDNGWTGDGLEPNAKMSSYGRTELGVNVVQGALETLPSELSGQPYDLLTMVQVVPHFYDVHTAFRVAGSITSVGGFWLVETWNAESLSARLFGRQWHEYSPPSVVRWFSPKNLTILCEAYGFRPVASGRPSKWISGAHAKSLLRYKLPRFPMRLGKHFLRLVPDRMRIPYPSEDLIWMLFKKTR
ncbi:MAG: class I SAM-dependent methyltransferase [Pirellula sp.]|nr:class I SAM-dependent methyltransferase [Pirellula sp.]